MDLCLLLSQRIFAFVALVGMSCIPTLASAQSQGLSSRLINPMAILDSERVANADLDFSTLVKREPQEEVAVNVFFKEGKPVNEVREILKKVEAHAVEVQGFRHVSGGYTLFPGQSVDEALTSYMRDHDFFIQKDIELMESMLNTREYEIDNELRIALTMRIKEKRNMQIDFKRSGLQIVGLELRGRVIQIQEFKDQEASVSFIERKIEGRPDPSPSLK